MKIVLTGGSGFIGGHLVKRLSGSGHEVIVLSRDPAAVRGRTDMKAKLERWDARTVGDWRTHISSADAVINLAGESLAARRWTASQKGRITRSRVEATGAIVEAIRQAAVRPKVLVSMSAVGYYGPVPDGDVTETYPRGVGFLAGVCEKWEEEARKAEYFGVRVVMLRPGVVLSRDGGALQKMILPFKLFVGGPLGSGEQWFPWVHRDDVIGALLFAVESDSLSGPVNVAAPDPVTMRQFCVALGKALHRPCWAPVPAVLLRLALGEMSEMLLTGQRQVPAALTKAGYTFRYPKLIPALSSIVHE